MATVAYTTFFPEVLPHVPGCPDPLALNAVRNACYEYCAKTMWWQETRTAVPLTALTLPYTLVAPTGATVSQILSVSIDGAPLGPTPIDQLDNRVSNWRARTGKPQAYYQSNPNTLNLYPIPDGTDSYDVVLRVAYVPTRASTFVDSTMHEYHSEEIASGALARLMSVPGTPWSNPEGAAYHRVLFNNAMVTGSVEATKSYTRTGMQIQMRGL